MIDQTHINLLDLIPVPLKKVASTNGGEYAGACPNCGGKDRFRVQPNARPNPRWFCRQCQPQGGDAIALLMWNQGMDFKQACAELQFTSDVMPRNPIRQPVQDMNSLPYSKEKETESDGKRWQERAHKFIDYAENQMWSDDMTGRKYLWNRGFYDNTIRQYRLGYCPRDMWDDWGLDKKVWLPRGILIPYERGEFATITKIRTRRLDWHKDDEYGKYIPPKGVKNTAFLTRPLLAGDYVLICEGELDAIIFKQEIIEPRFVAMATSGTHGAKQLQYLGALALAKKVIVAFDEDEAGENASKYWLDALTHNSVRLAPTRHDINDMFLADDNLHQWIRKAI